MAITFTIKQVPDSIAEKLRARAAANHRSLQGELLRILHEAVGEAPRAGEPKSPVYNVKRTTTARKISTHGRRLTLKELWERARKLGDPSPSESTNIIRQLRDERYRR